MNIRKTLLLALILAVASLGLTGCKQKSDQPPAEPSASEVAPAEEAAPAEHPTEHPAAEHPTEHPK